MTRRLSEALQTKHHDEDVYVQRLPRRERIRENMRLHSEWSLPLFVDLVFTRPELRGTRLLKLAEIIDESVRWNV